MSLDKYTTKKEINHSKNYQIIVFIRVLAYTLSIFTKSIL